LVSRKLIQAHGRQCLGTSYAATVPQQPRSNPDTTTRSRKFVNIIYTTNYTIHICFRTMGFPFRSPVLFLVIATTAPLELASQPLSCADLTVHAGGELQCSTFGGKAQVIELLGTGNSHACQELDVDPRMPYELSGEVYPRSACGSDVPCPPSVVVCPGNYAGGLHRPVCHRSCDRSKVRPCAMCRHHLRPQPWLRWRDPFGLAGRGMVAV
jgi:hypothetical protein